MSARKSGEFTVHRPNGPKRTTSKESETLIDTTIRVTREAVEATNDIKRKAREAAEKLNARAAAYSRQIAKAEK